MKSTTTPQLQPPGAPSGTPLPLPSTAGPKPASKPGVTPQSNPDIDLPIYEALLRAIQNHGLQNRLKLTGPPQNGAVTLEVTHP